MTEIALLAGSTGLLVLYAPLTLVHRGRAYVLVETSGNKIRLETAVNVSQTAEPWSENGLTRLTLRPDTTPP